MMSCAITDHGTMSGAIEFYKAARNEGIKPIVGIETYVAARTRFDRDPAKDKARYHLILLAMNETGYRNLMMLSSKANLEGMYYKPRIDHDLLEEYNEGIIALSACASGEVGESLRMDNYEEAKRIAAWYKSVFGDRYYLELQDHGHPVRKNILLALDVLRPRERGHSQRPRSQCREPSSPEIHAGPFKKHPWTPIGARRTSIIVGGSASRS